MLQCVSSCFSNHEFCTKNLNLRNFSQVLFYLEFRKIYNNLLVFPLKLSKSRPVTNFNTFILFVKAFIVNFRGSKPKKLSTPMILKGFFILYFFCRNGTEIKASELVFNKIKNIVNCYNFKENNKNNLQIIGRFEKMASIKNQ